MATMLCTVAIPTRELFSGEITYANVPSVEGYYGVLPGHSMLVASNRSGGVLTLNLDEDGREQRKFLLYEGASQVYHDRVIVLGRFGVNVDDINAEEIAEKAKEMRAHIEELESETAQDSTDQGDAELETSRARLEWYEMQLDYVKKGSVD